MGRDWVSVREFNLAIEDQCGLCGGEMFPNSKIWHVETRAGEGFCCSLEHAKEAGVRMTAMGRCPHVDFVMAALGLDTEEDHIDYFGLRPFLLPDDELSVLRESIGFKST